MLRQHALRSALSTDNLIDDPRSLELYPVAANKKRLNIFRIAIHPRMSVAKVVLDKTFPLNKLEVYLQLWSKLNPRTCKFLLMGRLMSVLDLMRTFAMHMPMSALG